MVHARCCVVTIKFTDLQNFHAFFIVINNNFFETLDKEIAFLWILTDWKTVTKLFKVSQEVITEVIIYLKISTSHDKGIVSKFHEFCKEVLQRIN